MQITLTARHFEITPHLRQYAIKKLSKLERFDHQILKGEVVFFLNRAYNVVEGKVHSGHFVFTAKGYGEDMYQAINDFTDKMIAQIERHLEKIRARRRRVSSSVKRGRRIR